MPKKSTAWLAPAFITLGVASWVACSGSSPAAPGNPTPGPSPTAQVQATPTPEPTPTPTATPTATPTPSASPSGDPGFAGPNPEATPGTCPMLTSWYSTIHNITDPNQRPTKVPVAGGAVVIDSTPLFNGRSCNSEHNFCGGRACEDPRGGDWSLIEGKSNYELRGDGYQIRIGPLKPGVHRWRVCPHYDLKDAMGEDVPQATSPCTTGSFEVMAQEQ